MKRVFAFLLLGIITVAAFGTMVFFYSKSSGKGALQVTSEPNSKVYLDGNLIGTTPLCKGAENCSVKEMIDEGEHDIKLVPVEGDYQPFEHKISISPKVLTVVDRTFADDSGSSASIITLTKLSDKNTTSLEVISFPQGSKVFLDGSFIGESPLLTNNVTDSDHELKLTKPGYKDKLIPIRTAKGYKLEVQMFLAASPEEQILTSTPSAAPALKTAKVIILPTPNGWLRVRSEPSLSGSQLGLVYTGEEYDLLLEQTGWFKIKMSNGKEGWVSSQFSQKKP